MPTVYELSDFFERYTTEIAVLAGFSVLLFFLALFGLPLIIIAIPANFCTTRRITAWTAMGIR